MTFKEYCNHVKKHGYFSVRLGDGRNELKITDAACDFVLDKWLIPLLGVAERAYVYRRRSKDRPFDVTPPPRGSKPVILAKTSTRVELDAKAMMSEAHRAYWTWALRHANITVLVRAGRSPIEMIAKESWDPGILTNLGAVVARGSIELARREVAKQNTYFLFSRDSYSVSCHIFAPPRELLNFYECFVMNCRFILKGLERDLMPVRRKRRN